MYFNDNVDGYYEELDAGDIFLRKQRDFVGQYNRYRQDIFSSDREVAALIFALNGMECWFNNGLVELSLNQTIIFILFEFVL